MADDSRGPSPVKQALAQVRDMRARLEQIERERNEPIAIVGLAGQFPGAPDADALWDLLYSGNVGIVDVPPDRWDVAAYYDPDPDAPGRMYTRRGGFLPDVSRFDAHFFGVSPREAVSMDPQQRLLLETVWRALENADIAPARLAGSHTGVFVGLSNIDYYRMAFADRREIDAYFGSGTSGSVAAGRISYLLGFRGPSLAVDTACSSSLVATHLACQSLRNRECEVALAGGVNLILSPDINIACSKARMLAADGLCKTFDARADGYVRSEGCAVVVLKRLSDAEAQGDRILALIRGSAVNQDGRSSGLTVPNGPSQEAVIKRALEAAGVGPSEIGYVEAHGTGTSLGDPIEVRALGRVFSEERDAPLAIGSIKANIGHLEAAAGIAGLVKVVLALQRGIIPGHPHLGDRNPHLDWASLPLAVPTTPQPWPAGCARRIAGVSSFGFSGTNAHLVLEEAPAPATRAAAFERTRHILTLSARTPEALERIEVEYERFLRATPSAVGDVCMSANAGRSHFAHRIAVVGAGPHELAEALARSRSGTDTPRVIRGTAGPAQPEAVFLFTGQGAQYAGMARVLFDTNPLFRSTVETCDRLLANELQRPLLSVLFGEPDDTALLSETAYAQPALFAVEYALAQLWRSWGVVPAAVLGHSVGELAAACVAGLFTLEDGLRLIAARGRLMQALPDDGAMASVFADEATVRRAIAAYEPVVSVAALNGPEQVVISGARAAVQAIASELSERGITSRDLDASRAFHSPLLEPMLGAFGEAAAAVAFGAPRIPIVSNLTGDRADAREIGRPEYWTRHARQPVRFQQSIETLRRAGHTLFVEIGPTPTLLGMARRFADAPDVRWVPSLRKGRDDWEEILTGLGTVFAAGCDIDWTGLDAGYSRQKVTVPGHPFIKQRYWLSSDGPSDQATSADASALVHPLLGRRVESPVAEMLFEQRVSPAQPAYLAEHRVFDSVVFPATGYLEMAAAAARTLGQGTPVVQDLVIAEPLTLEDGDARAVQTVVTPRGERDGSFQVFSRSSRRDATEWHLHASATVLVEASGVSAADTLSDVQGRCPEPLAAADHYELFARSGLDYGASFRGIQQLWRGTAEAVGVIELPADTSSDGYTLHPALLDSCFHVLLAALPGDAAAFTGRHFFLPVSVDRLCVARPAGNRVWAHARVRPLEGERCEAFTGDVVVFDGSGAAIATIDGLTAKRATADLLRSAARRDRTDWFYEVHWEPRTMTAATPSTPSGAWFVTTPSHRVTADLSRRLEQSGARVIAVDEEELARAIEEFTASSPGEPIGGIVYAPLEDHDSAARIDAVNDRLRRSASAFSRLSAAIDRTAGIVQRVLIVTRGATSDREEALSGAPLRALAAALGSEHPELRCVSIDLDAADAAEIELLWQDLSSSDNEDEIAYRGGRRFVARLRRAAADTSRSARAEAAAEPVALTIAERGILDNLRLTPITRRAPAAGEVEIEVAASGLNFRDVLNALGMYPGDPGALGNECVGTIVAVGANVEGLQVGQPVMALVHGGFQTFAVAPAAWVVPIPARLDMTAAATIPMAFATADYSLVRCAALKRGERVLIHAATGGVGLAAVQVATRAGAEIFATAGSDEKRAFLQSLGVRHIMNSRTVDFADEIMASTGGEGVDVVLNSLTGEAIPKSLSVLRKGGRFCEIGKRGIWSPAEVAAARPDVSYFTIFLGEVDDAVINGVLRDLAAAFEAGELQPLPRRVFALDDAPSAFRFMAQARHIGKIVLARTPGGGRTDAAIRENATYLITGGFGGLGLRIAASLVERGARHLVLVGRGGAGDTAREAIARWEEQGVEVHAAAADVSLADDVAGIVSHIAGHMPPLAGIVHAAGVREDGALAQLDAAAFERVLAPKVAGAWHLHRATGPLSLDFFVMFSSAASVLPSPGQGSYAAANAFLDALARHRRAHGLPALSINWGPWDDVGMAAGLSVRDQKRWSRHGVAFIAPEQGVRAFERLTRSPLAQVAVVDADWRKFSDERPGGLPLLADLVRAAAPAHRPPTPVSSRPALVEELERAPRARRRDVVLAHVREHVRQVLALEEGFTLDPHQGLRDVGMDSLMALELRNRLQRTTGKALPATLTFDRPTVEALTSYLCDDVLRVEDGAPLPVASVAADAVAPRVEDDAIAVVGIGCRFPGGANDGETFWQLLHDGVDAIREVPRDRWDIDEYYDPDPDAPGRMYTRFGGFLERVDQFDPQFFGISPREAESLDPQQRLLLEVSWEALEDAGQPAEALLGTRTGVFVGISTFDYALLHMKRPNPAALDTYFGTGTSLSVAAGRLAYSLGLQGPCMAVDTACSSSLVALHLASKSLRDRECRVALAGGVNLMLTPEPTVNGCRARMLAPDGRCKTFDASADGYVRGEGAGVVVLKRLGDARADGDRVLAIIRGTAVNQDGRSSGLTVPNGPAQQSVIRDALDNARIRPDEVVYIEAHGTGTALGDPIEVEALSRTFAEGRPADQPLVIGSVKTNIGHLEAAAGVAGLIKVILALRHEEIPAHLHFRTLNPHISLDGMPVRIATERLPWTPGERRRIAGISSFGFSGTNAHVVVEEAPAAGDGTGADRPLHILAISAKAPEALGELAGRYARHLASTDQRFGDVAFTANAGRTHFAHRLAIVAGSPREAASVLDLSTQGTDAPGIVRGQAPGAPPQIAFLFTGQGAQYAGMGRQLFETQPVFRDALTRCDGILREFLDVPLLRALYEPDAAASASLNETAYTQPALFAIEYALAQLWQSWGIRPAALLGHSVGEYVAAVIGGVFTFEAGLRLIGARARLMQALPPGAMAAVFASEDEIAEAIRPFGEELSIAAVNGPEHTVVSGNPTALADLLDRVAAKGIRTQRLTVSHAFHSAAMEPMLDEFERIASRVEFSQPTLPIASNISGRLAGAEIATARYWRDHVRHPVRFAAGVETLRQQGCRFLLEVGPRPTLLGMARRAADLDAAACLPSLRPPREDWAQMLDSVAQMYVAGVPIDWAGFERPYARQKVTLPTYPFQRERYWLTDGPAAAREPKAAVRPVEACEIAWRPTAVADHATEVEPGGWLVLADENGLGEELAAAIERRGGACLLARPAPLLAQDPTVRDVVYIDPVDGPAFRQLARDAAARLGPVRGVVHMWSLDRPAAPPAGTLRDDQARACGALLHLVQSVTTEPGFEHARLFVVTRGACATSEGAQVDVTQAPVWGLAQVIATEHPNPGCVAIDLDPAQATPPVEALVRETLERPGPSDEDRIALRDGGRMVARLVRREIAAPREPLQLFRGDATYVITGGMGGLGLTFVRHAVDRGARHLVLIGRRAPVPETESMLKDLEAGGAHITIARGDVSDQGFVESLLSSLTRTHPPVAGVIHAAGVVDDGLIAGQDWDRFQRVLSPKVDGAWNLHQATRNQPLDFFALFSSMASIVGSAGQGSYAAANAFLDALAHHRRSLGLPATCINWGPWASVGMAAALGAAGETRWAEQGISPLRPATAVQWFERAIAADLAQAGVLSVDWTRFASRVSPNASPLLRELAPPPSAEGTATSAAPAPAVEFRREVERTPSARRRDAISARVREEVVRVLGLRGGSPLADDQGFRDLGLDSLMAVELRNRLQAAVGEPLPATVAFDHPTVDALARYLAREVFGAADAPEASVRATIAGVDEPVAIVGLACRMPGGANTPDAFWQMLQDGVDGIREVPRDRWDVDALYDPDPAAPGKMQSRWGGFLADIDAFDPQFFGIAPREAMFMDPQQRLLLEVAWEALEDAGQSPQKLAGSQTGVFVGLSTYDYMQLALNARDRGALDPYVSTGNSPSVAAGRLSYVLGLQGPSMSIDTACSSSLVALHLACQSVRRGECRLALAGGVNLLLLPEPNIILSKARMLSPDGRCKTFDASANGYVRGEGCGIVIIKRLTDAIADRDRVLAVVRGTAVNQDGRSSGLTVPNGSAQEALIRAALGASGVHPNEVVYVEAHGTGTPLGDPIEIRALSAALGEDRRPDEPVVVGSVKTNVGHLEAAAGIAGVIKVVLAMQHAAIPPHLHFREPNPHIPWRELPVTVAAEATAWPANRRRIAGVSSFGFSGTNAHAILEHLPPGPDDERTFERPLHLLAVSARSEVALKTLAGRYAQHLAQPDAPSLPNVCFTANSGRSHFAHRLAIRAGDTAGARRALQDFCAGVAGDRIIAGEAASSKGPGVAFLFGRSAAVVPVARALFETQPAFRSALERCQDALRTQLDQPLLETLFGPDPLADAGYAEPALFALQYAFAELWRTWGVQPAAVLGDGVGEYVAACVAGSISLEAALALSAARGRALRGDPGAMDALRALARESGCETPQIDIVRAANGERASRETLAEGFASAHGDGSDGLPRAFGALLELGCRVFIQMGPGSDLADAGRLAIPGTDARWLTSSAGEDGWTNLLDGLARLYVAGAEINWDAFDSGYIRRRVALPTYPFERQRYWLPADMREGGRGRPPEAPFYSIEWHRQDARAAAVPGQEPGTWVILADRGGIGASLAEKIAQGGDSTLLVTAGPSTDAPSHGTSVQVDPASLQDLARLWRERITPDLRRVRGVVHLWSLDAPVAATESASDATACAALLNVINTVVERGAATSPLWVATRGAQRVSGEAVDPAQSPFWGLARTAMLEHKDLRCVLVDVSLAADAFEASSAIWTELQLPDDENQVAYRAGGRFVARLAAVAAPSRDLALRRDGTYLITGGTGGLGLEVARRMTERGAGRLVLVSRRGPSEAARAAIAALEEAGAAITVIQGDMARREDVQRVMDAIARDLPPLRGVVHAAGVLDDGLLRHQNAERLEKVFAPKASGAWNLHEATRTLSLDFFVLFSSVASVIGSPGQGGYGAANAFLDGLSHYRRSLGLPATSINWGPWADTGMAANDANQRRWAEAGIRPLAMETGLDAFERCTADGGAQMMVLTADWSRCAAAIGQDVAPPLLRALSYDNGSAATTPAGHDETELARLLAASPDQPPLDVIRAHVAAQLRAVMGLDSAAAINSQKGLTEMGLDSLMALDLRDRLQQTVGRPLPSTVAFDYPSIDALSNHLLRDVLEVVRPGETAPAQPEGGDDVLLKIEELSDEQVEELLARRGAADSV